MFFIADKGNKNLLIWQFQHYQLAVKALENIGVEVLEPHNPYEVTEEDIRSVALAREDIKHGRIKSSEQVFEEAKAKY